MYHKSGKTQESKTTQDWRGVRHARMSKSMFRLPPGAFKVLAGLRCALKDGETRTDVSQASIAELADVSEATVSRAMPFLHEAGYIVWEKADPEKRGRGAGHMLTLLPPPEFGSAADPFEEKGSELQEEGSDLQEEGSFLQDPQKRPSPPALPMQTAAKEGSPSDPSIFLIHAVTTITTTNSDGGIATQTGGGGGATREKPAPAGAPPLTETERLLIAYGMQPANAHKLAHLDPVAVRAGLKEFAGRGSGPGSVFNCWSVCPPTPPASLMPAPAPAARPMGPPMSAAERAAYVRERSLFAARGAS